LIRHFADVVIILFVASVVMFTAIIREILHVNSEPSFKFLCVHVFLRNAYHVPTPAYNNSVERKHNKIHAHLNKAAQMNVPGDSGRC